MIYNRVGWPTGYPNTSASLGVLGFWTLVGVGAERGLAWPARSLALAAAVPGDRLRAAHAEPRRRAHADPRLALRHRARARAAAPDRVHARRAGRAPARDPGAAHGHRHGQRVRRGHRGRRACCSAASSSRPSALPSRSPISASRSRRERRRAARPRRCRGRRRSSPCCWPASRCRRTRPGASPAPSTRSRRSTPRTTAGPHLLSVESNRWDFWKVAAQRPRCAAADRLRRGQLRADLSAPRAQQRDAGTGPRATAGARGHARPARAAARQRRRRDRPRGPAAPAQAAVGRARRCRCGHRLRARARAGGLALAGAGGRVAGRRARRLRRGAASAWGRSIPRRAARISGGIVLALALLWVAAGVRRRAPDRARRRQRRSRRCQDGRDASLPSTRHRCVSPPSSRGPARGLEDAIAAADRGPQEWSSWAVVARLAGNDKALVARACARARSENPRLESCP